MKTKIFILLLCFVTACKTHKKAVTAIDPNTVTDDTGIITTAPPKFSAGTVIKSDGIAGCSYVLKMEDERVLEPLNLADSLKKNNLRLWLRFHHSGDQTGICMMGEIVIIDDVKFRR